MGYRIQTGLARRALAILVSLLVAFTVTGCCTICGVLCPAPEPPGNAVKNAAIVNMNHAPSIEPLVATSAGIDVRVRTVDPGTSLSVAAKVNDRDGDQLTYKWSATSGQITGNGPQVTWLVDAPIGATDLNLEVSDGRGGSDRQSLRVWVGTGLPFSGQVLDTEGNPIQGADVEVAGVRTQTDDAGRFEVSVRTNQDRYVLNIVSPDHGPISRILEGPQQDARYSPPEATIQQIDATLPTVLVGSVGVLNCSKPLSAQVDWSEHPFQAIPRLNPNGVQWNYGAVSDEVIGFIRQLLQPTECSAGVGMSLPANALVNRSGNAPPGAVQVALSTFNLASPDAMSGNFSVATDGAARFMESFGAGSVVIRDEASNYQLRDDVTATIKIALDPTVLPQRGVSTSRLVAEGPIQPLAKSIDASQIDVQPASTPDSIVVTPVKLIPETIPLLRYDSSDALWHEIGEASLSEGHYVAEVAHLSAFNADLIKTDPACIRIESAQIVGDYQLEVTIPRSTGGVDVRSWNVNNTDAQTHVVYNLPSNTQVTLRPFVLDSQGIATPLGTFVVDSGDPYSQATSPLPEYPYGVCEGEAVFENTAPPDAPVLSGPAASSGSISLTWAYAWAPCTFCPSTNGYQLEESSTSSVSGFNTIYDSFNMSDRQSPKTFTVNRGQGTYWYRVRAHDNGWTDYSNVVEVTVVPDTVATTLRVVNDLYDEDDYWAKLNTIVNVRIGPTESSVLSSSNYEQLSPSDYYPPDVIPPGIPADYQATTSYREFDVTGYTTEYWVYIEAGWWDLVLDINTFAPLFWEKRQSMILNCDGQSFVPKWSVVRVFQPFGDPEVIRVSDFLPHGNWHQTQFCP